MCIIIIYWLFIIYWFAVQTEARVRLSTATLVSEAFRIEDFQSTELFYNHDFQQLLNRLVSLW